MKSFCLICIKLRRHQWICGCLMTPERPWRSRAKVKTRCLSCPQVVTVLTHYRRSEVKAKTLHRLVMKTWGLHCWTEHLVSFPFLYFFLWGGGPHIAVGTRWKWASDAKKDRAQEVERTWGWKVSWQTGRRLAACFLIIDDFLVTQQHMWQHCGSPRWENTPLTV